MQFSSLRSRETRWLRPDERSAFVAATTIFGAFGAVAGRDTGILPSMNVSSCPRLKVGPLLPMLVPVLALTVALAWSVSTSVQQATEGVIRTNPHVVSIICEGCDSEHARHGLDSLQIEAMHKLGHTEARGATSWTTGPTPHKVAVKQ